MPNILKQYYVAPNPEIYAAISLTLTNSLTHPADPTWDIQATLTIKEGTIVSEPQIEVSLTHA